MDPGNESPPPRSTILGNLLRGRPRNSSQSHINTDIRELSPSPPQPPSPSGLVVGHRRSRPATVQPSASHQATTPTGAGLGLSHMLRRRRSAGNVATPSSSTAAPAMPQATIITATITAPPAPTTDNSNAPSHKIHLVPHIESRRSLRFDAIRRDLREGDPPLRIGRFTDRSGLGLAAVNALGSNKLAFKSKVVSRAHAEIWVETGGKFFIKDTKSSSGTFLNHVRLGPANVESRPYAMKDGDILQLGVDYQGGTEDIYKSVKIRIEIGREWQAGANAFNTEALNNIKTLAVSPRSEGKLPINTKSKIPDCCICLFAVSIRQALFIAPCSHTFHYKCIRPLLETHRPAFSCPLCRTFADLDDDVEVEPDEDEDDESANGDAITPAVATAPTKVGEDRGVETETEPDGAPVRIPLRTLRVSGGDVGEVDADGDEVMLDLAVAQTVDSDGELAADPMGQGGVDSEGSGSGRGGGGSPALGDLGEVDGEDVIDIDGTVGGKRKR
ncbi:putative E3 ubiquitin-protein ligase dma1 [Hypsizygus marmoreus]|uniref:E3 ubiquitin-protein ligase dma1 n=1 Tax=Hypsizygus marmoreus TaxID=39966 RepID=A0A369JCK3_HYPMA|nr:putative E3 ubiquitin-protein ligase dma1 [Hypsizygus marmoreus]